MTQFNAFASKLRIDVLLCCSATVLLTACGGNIDAGGQQLPATAAGVTTDAGAAAAAAVPASAAAPAAAVEAIAEAAPAARIETAPAAGTKTAPNTSSAGAAGQAADVTTQAFELTGYDSNPLQAQSGQQDASANVLASIKQ